MGLPADNEWRQPKKYIGASLLDLLRAHDYLKGPWYLSAEGVANAPLSLEAFVGLELPVNGERHATLLFDRGTLSAAPPRGVVSSAPLAHYRELSVRVERNPGAVSDLLAAVAWSHERPKAVHIIGERIAVAELASGPASTPGVFLSGSAPLVLQGLWSPWSQRDGTYGRYVLAFEIGPDAVILVYRSFERYAAGDTFFLLSSDGIVSCGERTLGSD